MPMSPEQWLASQKSPATSSVISPEQWLSDQQKPPSPEEWLSKQKQPAPEVKAAALSPEEKPPIIGTAFTTILNKLREGKDLYTDIADFIGSAPAFLAATAAGLGAAEYHSIANAGQGTNFGAGLDVAGAIMEKGGDPFSKALGRKEDTSKVIPGVMAPVGSAIEKVSQGIGEVSNSKEAEDASKFVLSYLAPAMVGGAFHEAINNIKVHPPVAEHIAPSTHVDSWAEQISKQPPEALAQTAFKDKETGQVISSGPKHNEDLKKVTLDQIAEAHGTTVDVTRAKGVDPHAIPARDSWENRRTEARYEQGFITNKGDFVNRKEALENAAKTGQVEVHKDFGIPHPEEGARVFPVSQKEVEALKKYNETISEINKKYDNATRENKDLEEEPKARQERNQAIKDAKAEYVKSLLVHPLEFPQEGLHSGDMRKMGAPDFQTDPIDTNPAHVKNSFDFNSKGLRILKEQGRPAAEKFAKEVVSFRRNFEIPRPKDLKGLEDTFYMLGKNKEADLSETNGRLQAAQEEGVTPEMKVEWRRHAETGTPLSEEAQSLYNKYYAPEQMERKQLTDYIQAKKWTLPTELDEELAGTNVARKIVPVKENFLDTVREKLTGGQQGGFTANIERRRAATLERNLFAAKLPNGERAIVQQEGNKVIQWKNGTKTPFATIEGDLKAGMDINGAKIKEATVDELHQHTPYRYNQDSQAVLYERTNQLRDFVRSRQLVENLKNSKLFDNIAHSTWAKGSIPQGWRQPKYIDKLPSLRGYAFEPKAAEIIEDFAHKWQPNTLNLVSTALIKNMMLNPLPHMNNEAWHWYNARGLTGWVTPAGVVRLAKTGAPAIHEAMTQGPQFRSLLRDGASLLSSSVRNNAIQDAFFEKGAQEFIGTPDGLDLAKSLGMKPLELYNAISKQSSKAMWVVRDSMYIQLINETMLSKHLTQKEAIKEVERHMPSYRIPSRVLGNRQLSEILQNPNVSVFSRYHYGMVKSLVETAKDLSGVRGIKNFKEGVDTAAAITIALAVLYPLQDQLAQQLTGNKGAEARRAGPYHPIKAIVDAANGDKQPYSVLSSFFTFNPALLAGAQLMADRQLFNGQPIYHPTDDPNLIAKDIAKYAATQVPQVQTSLQVSGERGGGFNQWLAKQVDIKAPSIKQRAMEKQMKQKTLVASRNRKRKEHLQ